MVLCLLVDYCGSLKCCGGLVCCLFSFGVGIGGSFVDY